MDWKETRLEDGTRHDFEVWTTADQTRAAFVANGKVYPVDLVPPHSQITTCTGSGNAILSRALVSGPGAQPEYRDASGSRLGHRRPMAVSTARA
ncbi:MAG TPA: hypothetical protein VFX25_24180 [Streptosporangiaceae bacterium]|nr:hypothetical protein [Streptosporangiaceae bacterium]